MKEISLLGKHAIVTGASRGLGKAMAEVLTAAGARVVAMSRTGTGLTQVTKRTAAYAVSCDLADRLDLKRGFDEALSFFDGKLDILVNSAGVQRRHEIEDFPIEDWDLVLETNLTAVFEMCQCAGRIMLKQGNGKIINIASMQSFFGGLRIPAYSSSKGGVMQLTKALAAGWAGKGINVNAIAPGYFDTVMNENLIQDPARSASILERIPAHRWGVPEDIAGPCLFLASDLSDYVNGAILPVDGGYSCA